MYIHMYTWAIAVSWAVRVSCYTHCQVQLEEMSAQLLGHSLLEHCHILLQSDSTSLPALEASSYVTVVEVLEGTCTYMYTHACGRVHTHTLIFTLCSCFMHVLCMYMVCYVRTYTLSYYLHTYTHHNHAHRCVCIINRK